MGSRVNIHMLESIMLVEIYREVNLVLADQADQITKLVLEQTISTMFRLIFWDRARQWVF
jgi:hypothetical protein